MDAKKNIIAEEKFFELKTSSPYVLSSVNYENVIRNVKTRWAMFANTWYNQPMKEVFL